MKIADLLFPKRCPICRELVKNEELICEKCLKEEKLFKIQPVMKKTPFVDEKIAAAWYRGDVRKAVHRFKFNFKPGYAKPFAFYIYRQYVLEKMSCDIITYVPSNWYKIFRRGYNQAELLALELSKFTGKPVIKTVRKTRNTKSMYKLDDAQRRANVMGAFELCCEKGKIDGKSVLIVDDILTSGATVSEMAKVLKIGGAERVSCAVFACKKQ